MKLTRGRLVWTGLLLLLRLRLRWRLLQMLGRLELWLPLRPLRLLWGLLRLLWGLLYLGRLWLRLRLPL